MSGSRSRTRAERLFSAAVLRRTFEAAGPQHRDGFSFVYDGVLRDLDLRDEDVQAYLADHGDEVDAAARRRGRPS